MGLTISGSVDTDSLPDDLREQCRRILDKKNLKAVTDRPKNELMTDGHQYELTLSSGKGETERHAFDESQATPEVLELLDQLKARSSSRSKRSKKNKAPAARSSRQVPRAATPYRRKERKGKVVR